MEFEDKGKSFTNEGPGAFISDSDGGILSNPDLVWIEDEWTEERIEEAKKSLVKQSESGSAPSEFWVNKYKKCADMYWHEFYKRNQTNFYKDRHYLHVVFPELAPVQDSTKIRLLEVGCGVGNAVIPLLELNNNLEVCAFDFAKSAIQLLQNEINNAPTEVQSSSNSVTSDWRKRISAHVCNLVNDDLPVPDDSMDLVLCMFVLSALPPESFRNIVEKLYRVLKPGGKVLIRDYGRYDEAQLRFKNKSKLADNFYVRDDGTCAYYFEEDQLRDLFCSGDSSEQLFRCEECFYIRRQYANRKQGKVRYRVWVHGKFVKPM